MGWPILENISENPKIPPLELLEKLIKYKTYPLIEVVTGNSPKSVINRVIKVFIRILVCKLINIFN